MTAVEDCSSQSCLQRLHRQAAKTAQHRQLWASLPRCCSTAVPGSHCQLALLTALQMQPRGWMHPFTAAWCGAGT